MVLNRSSFNNLTEPYFKQSLRGLTLASIVAIITACASSPDTPRTPPPAATQESATAAPPPPPPGAFLAQLQPDINAELLALEVPIAIPTYLPPGFDLAAYDTGTRTAGQDAGPYYALIYRNTQAQCFAIEAASGGVGGPVLDTRLPIASPLFGDSYVLYAGQLTNLAAAQSAPPDLLSDWLAGDVMLYRYVGARLTMTTYDQPTCTDLPAEEAVKIVESLAYLTSNIYGDYWQEPGENPKATPLTVPD